MNIHKRSLALAAAAGVWLAGIGSAVVLAYALARPMALASTMHTTAARTATVSQPVDAVTEPRLLELDTIWLFGDRAHYAPTAVEPTPNVARDISNMTCTGWRELEAGSGHVQICE